MKHVFALIQTSLSSTGNIFLQTKFLAGDETFNGVEDGNLAFLGVNFLTFLWPSKIKLIFF